MTAIAGRFESDFQENPGKMMKVEYASGSNLTPLNSSSSSSSCCATSSLCVGCGSAIYDPFILHVQPDLEWHGRCLNCSKCHRSLGNDPTCFVRDGKAYCREDYFNTFFYRCAGCHQIVSKSDLVFRVRSRAFHLDCFRCVICDRLLQPGEEIAFQNEQVCCLNHANLSARSQPPLCLDPAGKSAWMSREAELAERCGFKGKLVSHDNNTDAQKCTSSHRGLLPSLLSNRSETIKASEPVEFDELTTYDELCLTEQFRNKTASVINGVRASAENILTELVSTEFPDAFCSSPQQQLRPNSSGSSLGVALRDTDSPMTASSETSSILGLGTSAGTDTGPGSVNQGTLMPLGFGPGGSTPCPNGPNASLANSNPGGGITNNNNNLAIGLDAGSQAGSGSSSSGTSATGCGDEIVHSIVVSRGGSRPGKSGGSKRSKDHKATRVRTVLNEKQLHTLRTCYAANPRPDALMKEQLVEMTSLSPRVIRVWFQNKRCKDKKRQLLLKQIEQHQQSGNRPGMLHGISLIASSPVHNDPSLMCPSSGIDIQQIPGAPQYWKAPSDMPSRPGSQCNNNPNNNVVYRPPSPYNPMKLKLPLRPATTNSVGAAGPSTTPPTSGSMLLGPGDNTPLGYPGSTGPIVSSTLLPPFSGSLNNSLSMLTAGDLVVGNNSGIPLTPTSSSMERARFGLLMSNPGAASTATTNLNLLQPNFVEEPSIPAFQQLMSNFDTTDHTQLNEPGGVLQSNVIFSSPHEFSKNLTTCPDSLILATPVTSQMPPNVSIPSRADLINSKLDSLLGCGLQPPMGFMNNATSSGGLPPLFAPTPNGHPPVRGAPSPNPFTLNILSNQSPGVFQGPGSYLHPGLSQSAIGAPSRAPLST